MTESQKAFAEQKNNNNKNLSSNWDLEEGILHTKNCPLRENWNITQYSEFPWGRSGGP